jgi:hypothetical protein
MYIYSWLLWFYNLSSPYIITHFSIVTEGHSHYKSMYFSLSWPCILTLVLWLRLISSHSPFPRPPIIGLSYKQRHTSNAKKKLMRINNTFLQKHVSIKLLKVSLLCLTCPSCPLREKSSLSLPIFCNYGEPWYVF